ncbi:TonB-dependent receptor domain-containing protein [Membranihabitans maritimus]|uniref:TonB-dependent receptor domain-containing protein n=1 Tax=Membranihabitans maritimus TaxID=2904244 RepID=UPI001F1C37AB|nr:TonB-dependent receptor [Membranihabitans maritimus]
MKYHLPFTILILLFPILLLSQETATGVIKNHQTGEALPYAVIYNTTNDQSAISDLQGKFEIDATSGKDTLVISSLGFVNKNIVAKTSMSVALKSNTFALEEVVVSFNREQENRTNAPVAISTLSPAVISDNKPTTIDQVLNQSPGVYMVDLGNEQHTMSIRKPIDYGASYLYMEDGVPIRTSGVFNHNALIEINMANVSRIEIVRGPSSSLYGSEAIGGAVNFITQKPSVSPTAGITLQGNDIGYKRADFYASNTFEKLGIRFSGYYADQQNGTLAHSDFNKLALSLSANYFVSEKTELNWSNSLVDYYSDMSGSLDSMDFYSKSYGSNQTFTNRQVNAFRSKLAINHYWNTRAKSSLTGYFRDNSIKQNPSYRVADDFKPWIPSGDPNLAHGQLNDNSFQSYGLIAQHKQDYDWLNSSLIGGLSLDYSPNTYNADYIQIFKNDDGVYESFAKTDSVLSDYHTDLVNVAAYFQGTIEPVENLKISGALRFDNFNYNFENNLGKNSFTAVLDGKNIFSRFTPKIGVTYDLQNNKGIYANFSQGFVPPQVTELYVGNKIPTLKPVFYSNYEIGGWMNFANQKAKLELSIYRMDGLNEIISVLQNDGTSIRQNAGETTHQGIEYSLMVNPISALSIRVSGTYAIHKFLDYEDSGMEFFDNRMPQAPNNIVNAQLSYKPKFIDGFRFSVEWQHLDSYFMDAANTVEYEGYDIFNVRAGYRWNAFEIWVNAINTTDQLYATVARANAWGQTYSVGNPRNFNIGIGYHFGKEEKTNR